MPSVALGTDAGTSGVLLERAAELSMLVDCLEAVGRSSRGHVLLVGGEAGVGKTTLLRRFCDARGQSARVLWGACDPLFTPSPLGPLLEVAEESGGELQAVVARGAMPYEVVTALGHELRARTPTVFVLEDVHWADEATLDVLRLLTRRVETVPALVVASYRDDELDRAHPLRIMLGELATSRTVGRMRLGRLSPGAVTRLAEPYGVDAEELYRKTAGNPFFVVEALAAGAEGIPDTVRDAVLARAARLSPEGAALLEAVAVVPPQAEPWLLEALAGDAADRLGECLASGMLVVESAGVAFRHELARLAVEARARGLRRKRHLVAKPARDLGVGRHRQLIQRAHLVPVTQDQLDVVVALGAFQQMEGDEAGHVARDTHDCHQPRGWRQPERDVALAAGRPHAEGPRSPGRRQPGSRIRC